MHNAPPHTRTHRNTPTPSTHTCTKHTHIHTRTHTHRNQSRHILGPLVHLCAVLLYCFRPYVYRLILGFVHIALLTSSLVTDSTLRLFFILIGSFWAPGRSVPEPRQQSRWSARTGGQMSLQGQTGGRPGPNRPPLAPTRPLFHKVLPKCSNPSETVRNPAQRGANGAMVDPLTLS